MSKVVTKIVGGNLASIGLEEFVKFCMDKKSGITVALIEAELESVEASYKKSANKAEKAAALYGEIAVESVTDETSVAEQKPKEVVLVKGKSKAERIVEEKQALVNMSDEEKAAHARELRESVAKGQERAVANVKEERMLRALRGNDEHVNAVAKQVNQQIDTLVNNLRYNLGEHRVHITNIVPFTKEVEGKTIVAPDKYGRIGYVDVLFPRGYAAIKVRNVQEESWEWYDFSSFNFNQNKSRRNAKWNAPMPASGMEHNLEIGSGIMRLMIRKDKEGKAYLRLPVDFNNKTKESYDILRTSDVRWGLPNSGNNGNVEAALTAMLQYYWEQLELENVNNRNDFDASCMNCRNLQWIQIKNGVDDDIEARDKKSPVILSQSTTDESRQMGQYVKQGYCHVYEEFVDEEAVETLNRLSKEERQWYDIEVVDPKTGMARIDRRYQSQDEIVVGGKPIKTREVRASFTESRCKSCPFYHKNAFKGEHSIGHAKVEKREELLAKGSTKEEKAAIRETKQYKKPYVQTHWTSRARAGRQAFETLIATEGNKLEWVLGFPAEVAEGKHVFGIRVKGIGGVNVYFSEEFVEKNMSQADYTYLPPTEAYDKSEAHFNKLINMVFYAAFNREKMSRENYESVCELVYGDAMKQEMSDKHQKRWDTAVYWFEQSIEWAKQKLEMKNRPEFTKKFYAGIEGYIAEKGLEVSPEEVDLQALGVYEIHIEDVIGELLLRVDEGGLKDGYEGMFEDFGLERGYEDLNPEEFIRYMDDSAVSYATEALMTGGEFVIVGGVKQENFTAEVEFARDYYGVGSDDEEKDYSTEKELVAGALQIILNRQVGSFLYGVLRAEDKHSEFLNLNICEDALVYIAEQAKLID